MSVRIREAIAQAASSFSGGVEAALFTTFTFDPGFFEANVLPTLFGIETRGAEARRAEVNVRLAGVSVAVFHDAAALSGGGAGDYRYQTWAVRVPGAHEGSRKGPYFHPKLMILAGRYEQKGVIYPAVYLACGSANLTLSGCGHNLEVLGETWIDDADAPAHAELVRFLKWLRKVPRSRQAECQAIGDILEILREIASFGTTDGPELHINGIGVGRPTFAERLRLEQTQRWDCLTVLSPYWSGPNELPALLDALNAKEVKLVPGPSREGAYGLTPAHLEELKTRGVSTCVLEDGEANRFTHAKLYVLSKERGNHLRVAIGSCNMTEAAHKAKGGNVEAMLILSLDLRKDKASALPKLRPLDLKGKEFTDESDDPPAGLPFDLTVLFDWKDRSYAVWSSKPPKYCVDVVLRLPAVGELALGTACENRRIACPQGPGKARGFTVTFTRNAEPVSIAGLFSEINLDHSTRDYTPRLSAGEIIDELRERSSGLTRCLERHRLLDEEPDGAGPDAVPAAAFNLYDFYAAVQGDRWRALGKALPRRAAPHERTRRIADLVSGPSSLMKLARAVEEDCLSPVHRFAVILEAHRVLYANRPLVDDAHLSEINTLLAGSRAAVREEIANGSSPDAPGTPDELLDWFEAEFAACTVLGP